MKLAKLLYWLVAFALLGWAAYEAMHINQAAAPRVSWTADYSTYCGGQVAAFMAMVVGWFRGPKALKTLGGKAFDTVLNAASRGLDAAVKPAKKEAEAFPALLLNADEHAKVMANLSLSIAGATIAVTFDESKPSTPESRAKICEAFKASLEVMGGAA